MCLKIQTGKFTRDWCSKIRLVNRVSKRCAAAGHGIEAVGAKLRDMMPWIKEGALVDKTKN